ncbi:hypothetical protein NW837_04095 [Synechococcus sp. R6-10]|uniref:PIN domain-containing protein n=2 Tax=unclassified Synechococcus TaxID=2626047 RepID=UPI0039C43C57
MTYLLDTNVISELRKHSQANSGVQEFLQTAIEQEARIYISVITLGELRRGVELMRHRGDHLQANLLERWLQTVVDDYADHQIFGLEARTIAAGLVSGGKPSFI